MQSHLRLALFLLLGLSVVAAHIVPRKAWTNRAINRLPRLHKPPRLIIVHHTVTAPCHNPRECIARLRQIQAGHLRRRFRDIGYNFLIGGDGRIYEGLGFGIRGEHSPGYNSQSIGIAFIGNYHNTMPPHRMLHAARRLIQIAVQRRQIQPKYALIGHCQARSTICPGVRLLNELRKWPHWRSKP